MDRLAAVLLTLLLGAVSMQDAAAQWGGGFPGGGGMRGGMRGGTRDGNTLRKEQKPVQRNMVDDVEDRLGLLEEDLQLTVAQQGAWQRYADQVKALAADITRERNRTQVAERQSVVQQIDHAVDSARNRLTALEDIAAAAKVLYGALSPEQQTRADPRLATIVMLAAQSQPAASFAAAAASRR